MENKLNSQIQNLYINQCKSIEFIRKQLKISRQYVTNYLHNNNLVRKVGESNRKYSQNDEYFHIIDTEDKAYWLGYFYADGNVGSFKRSQTKNSVILSSVDFEIVNKFKNSINYSGPIRIETHRKFCKQIYKICIHSNLLHSDLIDLGCVPTKSLIIQFPNLSNELIHHFIRGYFDGDGTVGIYKNTSKKQLYTLRSGFCSGSKDFLNQLITKIPNIKHTIVKTNSKKQLFRLEFSVKDSKNLYKFMYKNATIYLQRKKDIFDKYKEKDVQRL